MDAKEEIDSFNDICKCIYEIHKQFINDTATPRRFLAFVKTYLKIYETKKKSINDRVEGLKV